MKKDDKILENKNEANRKKHGLWFEEARQIFDDPRALLFFDADHSFKEDRFLLLGRSYSFHLFLVIFCEKQYGGLIRMISARKATKKEIERYEKGI